MVINRFVVKVSWGRGSIGRKKKMVGQ